MHPANEVLLDALIAIVAENGEPPLDMAKQMVQDAKRYRWMKANEHSDLAMELCMEVPADDWDAAIDRAMSK